jgi:DNA-binding CsgD family transcriptional regulator
MTSTAADPGTSRCPRLGLAGRTHGISARERDVLDLVSSGADDMTIARRLQLSHSTVRSHIRMLFSKLHASNRTQIALVGFVEHLQRCEDCRGTINFLISADAPGTTHRPRRTRRGQPHSIRPPIQNLRRGLDGGSTLTRKGWNDEQYGDGAPAPPVTSSGNAIHLTRPC